MEVVSDSRCFGGRQLRVKHYSDCCQCTMHFSLYLPPLAESEKVPLLTWLSGLTCTDENFVTKAGAQKYAAEHGLAILAPDTSPRGDEIPDDPENSWDFGKGAGFYVNATAAPWTKHYQMYDYIRKELPTILSASDFNLDMNRQSILGHSMGGHGALTIALKNPTSYCSVSAFAPISAPMQCPWGEKALSGYLGNDKSLWQEYDTCELIKNHGCSYSLLIDQGSSDNFLESQLKPSLLEELCLTEKVDLQLRMQEGYDHSYFFIASFISDHIAFHAQYLNSN